MTPPPSRSRSRRSAAFVAALAVALLLRLMVPAGWMPVADAAGLRLAPCDGMGPMTAMPGHRMAGMDHHHQGDDRGMGDHACGFGGLAFAASEPFVPSVAAPAPPVAIVSMPSFGTVAIGRGLAAPPPPARGPPTI